MDHGKGRRPHDPRPIGDAAAEAVSEERLARRLAALSAVGRVDGGGITRLALTPAEQAARRVVADWLKPLGYTCRLDAAANLVAESQDDRGILLGSHLDTVPGGGAYDGALGVVSAVELAEALHAAHAGWLPRIVAWMGEEGPRFGRTLLGSAAATGLLGSSDWLRRDPDGRTFREEADYWRNEWPSDESPSAVGGIRAYLEVHMEQGPRLAEAGVPVAVVSAIAGVSHVEMRVAGRADHAGTVPMGSRRDALAGAAEMIVAAERMAIGRPDNLVATVGEVRVNPGAQNVIPGAVTLRLDIRSTEDHTRQEYLAEYEHACQRIAVQRGLKLVLDHDADVAAVVLDADIQSMLKECVELTGQGAYTLHSGAVHDAQSTALVGIPTGMLFVRSEGGSHNPDESVTVSDTSLAVRVLALAAMRIARPSDANTPQAT